MSCISIKHQECRVRPEIINVKSNNPIFYPFSIKINKCSGNCNNINNPYAKMCVPDVIKDLNVEVFKWRCECKGLIDKRVCDKGFIWNPSNCECECDKTCDIGEYLDYKNCKCRKRFIDKLIEECMKLLKK